MKSPREAGHEIAGARCYLASTGKHSPSCDRATAAIEARDAEHAAEVARLKSLIDRDRTGLALGLNKIQRIAKGFDWICEGRGPYEYDDDRYRMEVGSLITKVLAVAQEHLHASGELANEAFHPRAKETARMLDEDCAAAPAVVPAETPPVPDCDIDEPETQTPANAALLNKIMFIGADMNRIGCQGDQLRGALGMLARAVGLPVDAGPCEDCGGPLSDGYCLWSCVESEACSWPDGRPAPAVTPVPERSRMLPEGLVREHLAHARSNLEGWSEDGGFYLPTEPDAEERERVRERLRAVIFAYERVLGIDENSASATPPTPSAPPAPREDWPPMAVKLDAGEPSPSPEVRLIRATPVAAPSAPPREGMGPGGRKP